MVVVTDMLLKDTIVCRWLHVYPYELLVCLREEQVRQDLLVRVCPRIDLFCKSNLRAISEAPKPIFG